ncbi:MAG: hypothetical protein ACNA77_03900 [Opitutales bacterium]
MRLFNLLATGVLILTTWTHAQDGPARADAAIAVEIPTEVSDPPYAVGDLVMEQGYYLDRGEEETRINLRFEGNRIRLYWIDENGLIAEPEAEEAVVRFIGSVRGRRLHQLTPLAKGAGLGSPTIMPPPHIYNMVLHIPASGKRSEISHSFRYTADLSVPVDPATKKGDS